MHLLDMGMVIADTSRTRAYIQGLVDNDLFPNYVLIMKNETEKILPGQSEKQESGIIHIAPDRSSNVGFAFKPAESIEETLKKSGIPLVHSDSIDINSDEVINILRERTESVFVYSGFGGVILRDKILGIGKKFLHVHGGYLPDYKGSTTNYYSLINENECGASSLFLEKEIDSGPILIRKKFPPPPNRERIDHLDDSIFRTKVLVETLRKYVANGSWLFDHSDNRGGETFYIIHPVLKHIAILSNR